MLSSDSNQTPFRRLTSDEYKSLNETDRQVRVLTYRLSPDKEDSSCTYTEVSNTTMLLGSVSIPPSDVELGFYSFSLQTIAVYCRQNYTSVDFPNNPRLNS